MSNYIAILDPSIQSNDSTPSKNLGDIIIYDSIKEILQTLFPKQEIIRISTHERFSSKELRLIREASYSFVGGTNILTSDIRNFNRFTPNKRKGFYFFPGFSNTILLGAGWNKYDSSPDWATKIYYKNILSRSLAHSLRDRYSQNHMNTTPIKNTLFTSCPTVWNLSEKMPPYDPSLNSILFTLTENNTSRHDEDFLHTLLQLSVARYFFFPQGFNDVEYLHSLETFKKNKSKFSILNHDFTGFKKFLQSESYNYIGTRLHGGIKSLSCNNPTLILSIDNRAKEMAKDINLPVVNRADVNLIIDWVNQVKKFEEISLPLDNIQSWKSQFK